MATGPGDIDFFAWNRIGGNLGIRTGHAYGDYWNKHGAKHPEWFSMAPNGSRDQTVAAHRPRLCKTNPELLDFIAGEKIAEVRANPSLKSLSISPNDGSGRSWWCRCENCKKLDPPGGRPIRLHYPELRPGATEPTTVYFDYVSLTDRVFTFYNEIAARVTKVYPDMLFGVHAYSYYSAPPIRAKVHPNLVLAFVPTPIFYVNRTDHERIVGEWDGWAKAGARLLLRPNLFAADRPTSVLINYTHRLAADLRHFAATGMIGSDFDSLTHNWVTGGINYYAATRLLWDPELDIDALVADYCRAGFGPAAPFIQDYLRRIEACTDVAFAREIHLAEPFTPTVLAELRALLEQADNAARGNPDVLARLAFLRTGFEFTAIQARLHELLAQPAANRDAARKLLDQRQAMMHDIFRRDPLAVNVCSFVRYEGLIGKSVGWIWAGKLPVDNGDL